MTQRIVCGAAILGLFFLCTIPHVSRAQNQNPQPLPTTIQTPEEQVAHDFLKTQIDPDDRGEVECGQACLLRAANQATTDYTLQVMLDTCSVDKTFETLSLGPNVKLDPNLHCQRNINLGRRGDICDC